MVQPRVAIIGTGIAGLTAASHLNSSCDITVFEASSWIGGHTNTIDVERDGRHLAIDTGFIVFNDRTYPHFVAMLDSLGVKSQPAPMTFSVRCDASRLEYRGADPGGLFAQRRNLLRPRFYSLLNGIVQFNRAGQRLLDGDNHEQTVKEFFQTNRFSRVFYEKYFLPMGSAIWSCPHSTLEEFPIRFVAEFYHHHGLLGLADRPQWRVVCGGSKNYVGPLVEPFRSRIQLNTPVIGVDRREEVVVVKTAGEAREFEHVVFACHADQSLELLGNDATAAEREILGAFPYETNEAVLHTDESIMPRRRRAWASWNYLIPDERPGTAVASARASLTYCMNILQSLDSSETWCVTLNNTSRIDPEKIVHSINYSHPVFDLRRTTMQSRHGELIGPNRTSFCGAYWGNGFHEDGVVSGLSVARLLMDQITDKENANITNQADPAN